MVGTFVNLCMQSMFWIDKFVDVLWSSFKWLFMSEMYLIAMIEDRTIRKKDVFWTLHDVNFNLQRIYETKFSKTTEGDSKNVCKRFAFKSINFPSFWTAKWFHWNLIKLNGLKINGDASFRC